MTQEFEESVSGSLPLSPENVALFNRLIRAAGVVRTGEEYRSLAFYFMEEGEDEADLSIRGDHSAAIHIFSKAIEKLIQNKIGPRFNIERALQREVKMALANGSTSTKKVTKKKALKKATKKVTKKATAKKK